MEMTYGLNITNDKDRFLQAAIEASGTATRAMVPGAFLVDIIPMRMYHRLWQKKEPTV